MTIAPHVPIQEWAPGKTEVLPVAELGRHFEFDYPTCQEVILDGAYASVNLNRRLPLLGSARVHNQLYGPAQVDEALRLGDFMAEIELPSKQFIGIDKATREVNRVANTICVFRRFGQEGPEYTIIGSEALEDLRRGATNPSMVRLGKNRGFLAVGREGWLPSSNTDNSTSALQGAFLFDAETGDLLYRSAAARNPAYARLRRTEAEAQQDKHRAEVRQAAQDRLRGSMPTRVLGLHGTPHQLATGTELLTMAPAQRVDALGHAALR